MTEQNLVETSGEKSKDSLKVQALTQRIATLVAQYEEQMADLRAEATLIIEQLSQQVADLQGEKADMMEGDGESPEKESPDSEQG